MTRKSARKSTSTVISSEATATPDFITVKQAAEVLKLSEISIRRFLTQKKLRRFKVAGGRTLLRQADVLALVREA